MNQEPNSIREEIAMIDEQIELLDSQNRSSYQVELLERAAKLAERLQDHKLMFRYYRLITSAIYYSSDLDLMFIYFPKMLKMLDDRPGEFSRYEELLTLFKYKWMIAQALDHPQIPLTRVEALCDDFKSRLQAINFSLRPVISMRCYLERGRMNYERALALNEEVERHVHDSLSDCQACEHSSHISSLFNVGRAQEGDERFEMILKKGQQCDSAPFTSYAEVACHALIRGDTERADHLYRRGWELIQHLSRKNLAVIDHHLMYFAYVGELELVKRELSARVSEVWVETQNPNSRMYSCSRLVYVLDVLLGAGLTRLDAPRFDTDQLSWDEDGLLIEQARDLFAQEARRLARLFDQRNEHTRQSQKIEGLICGESFK